MAILSLHTRKFWTFSGMAFRQEFPPALRSRLALYHSKIGMKVLMERDLHDSSRERVRAI